ncbi:hypothetical protein K438DRAFT_248224 [Mycena galopus ATCC 62051]|nr:hypothetical protein K438DRAFT_248224 [Mycena galopus ATCC 62051]
MGRMRRRMGLRGSWCGASRRGSMFLCVAFLLLLLPALFPPLLASLLVFLLIFNVVKTKYSTPWAGLSPHTPTAMAGSTAWPTASPASASASTTRTHVRSRIASFRCGASAVFIFFSFSSLSPAYTLLPVDLFSPYLPISPPSPHLLLPLLPFFPSSHHLSLLSPLFVGNCTLSEYSNLTRTHCGGSECNSPAH